MRKEMATKLIFQNQHYTACVLRDGSLVVTANKRQRGRRGVHLVGQQAAQWVAAILTAIDGAEANALCRAVVNMD